MALERARGEQRGFLARLRRDTTGNTMAIMAAALVPLIGFTGSAVDMARLYVVKVRLQQACDAGVLASRRAMNDTNPGTDLDPMAKAQGQQFFTNNFQTGWFQASNPNFTQQKAQTGQSTVANAVTGTATTTVPMVLMSYFGAAPVNLTVSCQAVFDSADTDVVFVLDTTGSMSCYPSDPDNCNGPIAPFQRTDTTTGYYAQEKSQTTDSNGDPMYSKIESLRQAVVLFDQTIRNVADLTTTNFRYGFVPYSSSVNIGAEIKRASPSYLQTSWTYQSRQVNRDYQFGGTYTLSNGSQTSGPSSFSLTGIPQGYCQAQRYPSSGYSLTGLTWGNAGFYLAMSYYNLSWTSANSGTCSGTQQPLRPVWRYQPYTMNLAQYVAGNAVANPSRLDGSTSKWRGCVEELNTTASSSFDVSNLPDDLNPDVIPTSSNELWRPMWPDLEWLRSQTALADVNDDQVNEANPTKLTDYTAHAGGWLDQHGYATCGMAAQRLQKMTSQDVQNYVYANDFRAFGGTYHDVGMIWGTRMLSTKGVFASDTTPWPNHSSPSRNIVFITDGAMAPNPYIYGQYGTEALDQRVTGNGDPTTDYNNHVARFRVECDAAKARGITIYVVAVGTVLNDDLKYCETSGQGFTANNTQQLTDAFANIARRVAKLRISQ